MDSGFGHEYRVVSWPDDVCGYLPTLLTSCLLPLPMDGEAHRPGRCDSSAQDQIEEMQSSKIIFGLWCSVTESQDKALVICKVMTVFTSPSTQNL